MKISVAICTYNGEKFIEQQLQSILNQTLRVDEIVISDDNSDDKTIEILEQYKFLYPDIISINRNDLNVGTIRNFEIVISHTTGDFIFLSDQDDIWLPKKVETTIKTFDNNSELILLFSNGELITEAGEMICDTLWNQWGFDESTKIKWNNNQFAFRELLRNNNKVTGATIAFKSELKKFILPIRIPIDYWHDAWFALHSAGLNKLGYIDECLIYYRIHPFQQVGILQQDRIVPQSNLVSQFISFKIFKNEMVLKYPKQFSVNEFLCEYIYSIYLRVIFFFHKKK